MEIRKLLSAAITAVQITKFCNVRQHTHPPFSSLYPSSFFGKKVRERVFPYIVSSGFDLSMQGNKLSLTFFKKRRIGRGKRRVSVLSCMISTEFDISL